MIVRCLAGSILVLALGSCASAAPPGQPPGPLRAAAEPATEILWDRWGVPHIFAGDQEGVAFGFGWAQMHSHGDAILRLYGLARGQGAEHWGERYLASDRLVHALGVPAAGVAAYDVQSPEFRRFLDAFVAGINAYAARHPETVGSDVRNVLPVRASDVLAHGHRLVVTFASITGNRPPLTGFDGLPPAAQAGSNTWAIGPSRTATGNAMLLQNPHLPWGEPLMRFYEAHLVAPGVNVYGATLLGIPVPAIAFNQRLGWSHTVNVVDVLDTYALTLDGGGYRFDGAVREFQTDTRVLRVRGEGGEMREDTLRMRRSIHGPVLMENDTSAVAVRLVALDRHGAMEQWWQMGRAANLAEFEAALQRMQLPIFTVSYADADGRVLYLFNGQIPRRPSGEFATWQRAVRGDTSAMLWTDIHDYADLPRLVDPVSGFVQNANSPPWFATYPAMLDPTAFPRYFSPDYLLMREKQSLEMLLAAERITLDDLVEMRHFSRVLLADRVLQQLVDAARAEATGDLMDAAQVLESWDRRTESESRGALLFWMWAREHCRGPTTNPCGFQQGWSRADPLSRNVRFADPGAAAAALQRAAAQTRELVGSLDAPWGAAMRVSAELPGRGGPGDPLGIFQVVNYAPGPDGFRPVHGDTWVAALEFTGDGPRGRLLMSYGNASQPGSPHNGDQLPLLARGEMRPLWFTRHDIEANLLRRELLRR